jgi:RNA polymerase sigma factor (sigma-70 family)
LDLDDIQLVQRVRSGDSAAFRTLVERYQKRVFGVALGMLKDRDEAEDAAQEVFLRVYRHLEHFKGDASFATWLTRITSNVCIDALRRKKSGGGGAAARGRGSAEAAADDAEEPGQASPTSAAAIAAVSSGMDVLSQGTECWYERNGERKLATVLSVDYGDDPPFYVIRMDGAERQTVRKYLIQLTMRERVLAALGAEAEAYQVLGTALITGGPLMIASDGL